MVDIDPPWRFDPLQTVTDVHWWNADYAVIQHGGTLGSNDLRTFSLGRDSPHSQDETDLINRLQNQYASPFDVNENPSRTAFIGVNGPIPSLGFSANMPFGGVFWFLYGCVFYKGGSSHDPNIALWKPALQVDRGYIKRYGGAPKNTTFAGLPGHGGPSSGDDGPADGFGEYDLDDAAGVMPWSGPYDDIYPVGGGLSVNPSPQTQDVQSATTGNNGDERETPFVTRTPTDPWWIWFCPGVSRPHAYLVNLLQIGQDLHKELWGDSVQPDPDTGLYPPCDRFSFGCHNPGPEVSQKSCNGTFLLDRKEEGYFLPGEPYLDADNPATDPMWTMAYLGKRPGPAGRACRVELFQAKRDVNRQYSDNPKMPIPFKAIQSTAKPVTIDPVCAQKVYQRTVYYDYDIFKLFSSNPVPAGGGSGEGVAALFPLWHIRYGRFASQFGDSTLEFGGPAPDLDHRSFVNGKLVQNLQDGRQFAEIITMDTFGGGIGVLNSF